MSTMVNLTYQEWDEPSRRVVRTLHASSMFAEDLFVRKLVNGTVIRNSLYHHTSHESEDEQRHFVYAALFRSSDLELYGAHVQDVLFERCDRAARLEAEFLFWHSGRFEHGEPLYRLYRPLEIAQLLLDHYFVQQGTTYESLYTAYDDDRNKVIFFLKEV
ncbi:hypothetical protein [Paenibacillus sp. R14(2021)]|uniref:hypothetical protein n=1 Tax=Paenibacillus sp. R14(2021) TaxID=2859228 RepID=UPI001C613B78|nr:hypothetical protein [Paenibacillus sp. R14(2021)]